MSPARDFGDAASIEPVITGIGVAAIGENRGSCASIVMPQNAQ